MGMNAAVLIREPIKWNYVANNQEPNYSGRPRVEAVKALSERGLCCPLSSVTVVSKKNDDRYWDQIVTIGENKQLLRLVAPKTMGRNILTIDPVV